MGGEYSCIQNAVFYSVILNLVFPFILSPFATSEERNPPNGAHNLSLKGQFMYTMVYHNQIPILSSISIGLIVGLSVYLGYKFKVF